MCERRKKGKKNHIYEHKITFTLLSSYFNRETTLESFIENNATTTTTKYRKSLLHFFVLNAILKASSFKIRCHRYIK